MKMKIKKNILVLVLLAVLLPISAFGATLKGGESYTLKQNDFVSDNLYVGAGEVSISGNVFGDLFAGGGSVTISGIISQDVIVGGGDISVIKKVGGDLRIIGGNVIVTADVAGDLIIIGGNVRILSDVTVGNDLVVMGGRVVLDGDVRDSVTIVAGEVEMDSKIRGDVYIKGGEEVNIKENTVISGNLTYSGKDESIFNLDDKATVLGETIFKESKALPIEGIKTTVLAFFGIIALIKLLALITVVILAVTLFKGFSTRVVESVVNRPGRELIRGFVVLIVVPFAIIVSFTTVIGFVVGLLGLLAYIILIILSLIYSGVIFGVWIHKYLKKEDQVVVNWKNSLLGIILLSLVTALPFIGWIFGLFFFLVSVGAISNIIYQSFWLNRN